MLPLAGLQEQTLAALRPFVRDGTDVALLDFPRHRNSGDSLIWTGTLRYLERLGATVRFACDQNYFDPAQLRRAMPTGTVLIQGGGNLGDKWPGNAFRLRALAQLADYPVVQLPQGLDFAGDAAAADTARAFAAHPDLTVFVRDHDGVALARRLFDGTRVLFCPDMSLGAGMLARAAPPAVPYLFLLRGDVEKVDRPLDMPSAGTFEVHDWRLAGSDGLRWRLLRLPEDVARVVPPAGRLLGPAITRSFGAMADLNVAAARRILARGRVVVTDRLHAMVLASLSSIPVVALDNTNGKVAAVHRDYLRALPDTLLADDGRHALELATALLDRRV